MQKIIIKNINTPIGEMIAGASDRGLCFLLFADINNIDKLKKKHNIYLVEGVNKYLTQIEKELSEYFDLQRTVFNVTIDMLGTDFQKSIWQTLCNIEYGRTVSYLNQAKMINNTRAVRAVAMANSRNNIAIVIPCHRVISSSGQISGYNGGQWRKKYLLDLEQKTSVV